MLLPVGVAIAGWYRYYKLLLFLAPKWWPNLMIVVAAVIAAPVILAVAGVLPTTSSLRQHQPSPPVGVDPFASPGFRFFVSPYGSSVAWKKATDNGVTQKGGTAV